MLRLCRLDKAYGNQRALDGATLRVRRGETLALMGPSGCGKSTLLRCVQRLVEPDRGEIWFDGASVLDLKGSALRAFRRRVGFVFQHQNLIRHMSALDNVALGLRMAGFSCADAQRRAEQALDRVGLLAKAGALPSSMSGGERQRVGIARALAMDPELLLWDEPTAALDPVLVEEVLTIMADLAAEGTRAMIVVTHEIPFALRAADRLALMDAGKIVECGRPRDVLANAASKVGQGFMRLYRTRHLGAFGGPGTDGPISGRNGLGANRSVKGHFDPGPELSVEKRTVAST